MKTKYISGLLALSLLIITSCKKELVPQESSGVNTISTTDNTSTSTASSGTTSSAQDATLPQQNANSNSVGMNPPHGQAGHRCDIAVGAPLNSPPNKSASVSKPGSNPTAPAIVKSNAPAVVTKPGMNPPHGQAGHRCDIAVGAPLNSPSSKVVPVPPTTNSESNSQVPALLKLDSTAISPKQ
jgi:hypothetical protein